MKNKNMIFFGVLYLGSFTIRNAHYLLILIFMLTSCEDFVDVDLPKSELTSEAVFQDASTAVAALRSIYTQMRDTGLESRSSLDLGLYSDELDWVSISSPSNAIYDHTVIASNGTVSNWWLNTYNLIYSANAVIEGIDGSDSLDEEDRNRFRGEALFIRAYLHSLLVELFGPIPYITTTDYRANTVVSRMGIDEVYVNIKADLTEALDLLNDDISEAPEEKIRPYGLVVQALLARVHLYMGDWINAVEVASTVIDAFALEPDLNQVFLKNSSGTIWQYIPFEDGDFTIDANNFVFINQPNSVVLTGSLLDAFEAGDQRRVNWIGTSTSGDSYAFKYKQNEIMDSSTEYPVVFRLAEQYLIRAEAYAQQGRLAEAQSDLNVIRNRAGLDNTMASSKVDLLEAIFKERRVELFTEKGHRWFDLKRTGNAKEVLSPIKSGWRDTDVLFPIPETELLFNPNLLPQNDGY